MKEIDLVFECKKCAHQLYLDNARNLKGEEICKRLFKTDCPNCGEESDEIWILIGFGNYSKESKT